MWDRPQSLNRLSSVLMSVSLLLVLYGALHYTLHLPVFPLRVLELDDVPQRVDLAEIEAVARTEVRGNFFTADIERIRRSLEKLHWVRKASVRRNFPWGIEVKLEEHEVLAHWNGSSLVNTHGEVFTPSRLSMARLSEAGPALPKFYGLLDTAPEIAQMYRVLGEQVAPLGWKIAQISLSPRRAWQLRIDNGMVLELGSEQVEQRLARFAAIYPYS
ncbi:MAG: cell division protein FtsQ/DivIB, partial [Gallionellaceae bacterium]|nr:cell division protein FtsQ/DivIB [Gallionellaceae bacterium]